MIGTPEMQVMIVVLVLAGLIGWSLVSNWQKGIGAQPTWHTPEYLRYNQPGAQS